MGVYMQTHAKKVMTQYLFLSENDIGLYLMATGEEDTEFILDALGFESVARASCSSCYENALFLFRIAPIKLPCTSLVAPAVSKSSIQSILLKWNPSPLSMFQLNL